MVRSLVLSCVVIVACAWAQFASAIGFADYYDPSNWTLVNNNADGFLDLSPSFLSPGPPQSIWLFGGDNGSDDPGTTDFLITIPSDGIVSFDWDYFSGDDSGFDGFGFLINGSFTLVNDSTGNILGSSSTPVSAGDIFGFRLFTTDNLFGAADVIISNFAAPSPTPEPVTAALGVLSLAALGYTATRRRMHA